MAGGGPSRGMGAILARPMAAAAAAAAPGGVIVPLSTPSQNARSMRMWKKSSASSPISSMQRSASRSSVAPLRGSAIALMARWRKPSDLMGANASASSLPTCTTSIASSTPLNVCSPRSMCGIGASATAAAAAYVTRSTRHCRACAALATRAARFTIGPNTSSRPVVACGSSDVASPVTAPKRGSTTAAAAAAAAPSSRTAASCARTSSHANRTAADGAWNASMKPPDSS
mmetsp:Transcript_53916/g.132170  ORF Transcript_53916/g.132170 Transcript_53916/m.132170 type:complete len:230 (+) Transcript_53916:729-1418(+)